MKSSTPTQTTAPTAISKSIPWLEGIAGFVFGTGLIVSGMTNPAKVIGFLDLFGLWDPSLALVMVGAIAVGAIAFSIAKRRQSTLLGQPLRLPTARHIDLRLIAGGFLFGAGWGVAGFCPGPAIVSAAAGYPKAIVFVAAMLVGMVVFEWLERHTKKKL